MSNSEKAPTDQLADWKAKKEALRLVKDAEKPPLERKNENNLGSNPSGSTFKAQIVSQLQKLADHSADQNVKQLLPLRTKWEGPFIYEPPGGDLKKDWLVWLKYQHPLTGKFERFRFNHGFNQYTTKTERRQHGIALKKVIDDLLKQGWTPFDEYNVFENQRDKRVCTLIDRYLAIVEPTVRKNTYEKYRIELNLFKKWLQENSLGEIRIEAVTKTVVTSFLNHYKISRSWSGKTYNHYLNDLTTFFNYFHDNYDGYLDKVPTLSLKRQPVHRTGNLAWNDYQFKKLKEMMLEAKDEFLYTFCSFVYYAALRNEAEATQLKAGDFNFKTRTLKIESGTAKNRTTEFIPIYPDFLDLLYVLKINEMDPELYIFGKPGPHKNIRSTHFTIGAPYPIGESHFARRFKPFKKALGIPPDEHGIYRYKHTRAVHLGEDGEDLYKIMKLFRHRDLATTMIYMRGLGVDTQNTEYKKGRRF